jgi:Holliday junction resolvase-like predicted endonuclease
MTTSDFPSIIFPIRKNNYRAVEDLITAKQGDIYENILYNNYLSNSSVIPFKATEKYCELDFIGSTERSNIFIELKSRNCKKDTYPNTIVGINKIVYFDKLNALNKNKKNRLFLIFCYDADKERSGDTERNGNKVFYYIKYEPTLFKTFETTLIYGKKHTSIPIEYLQPIANIYDKLATY